MRTFRASAPRRRHRGTATVELALVAPLLVTMAMFGMYLLDIARAKLKLQEAARYVAWEMTSYTLSDFGRADHAGAFESARRAAVAEATERFRDFDSVEDGGRFGFAAGAEPLRVTIENQAVPFVGGAISTALAPAGVPSAVLRPLEKGAGAILEAYRFDTHGKVEVTVSSAVIHPFLPRHFLERTRGGFFGEDGWGGHALARLPMSSRFTLVASGWHLPDGGDHVINTRMKRAGLHGDHEGGLRAQVKRMVYLGVGQILEGPLAKVQGVMGKLLPTPSLLSAPAFVVSHNYGPFPNANLRNCNTQVHSAPNGMSNLDQVDEGRRRSLLDQKDGEANDWMRCFDTAPFRDTDDHTRSLYQRIFEARGPYFMGCKNAQADDPTRTGGPGSRGTPCQ